MKICTKCKEGKLPNEFSFRNKNLKIRQPSCKTCTRLQIRKHYKNNKTYYLEKARKRNKTNRDLLKKYVWEYLMEHPCVDCGEDDPVVLDFDHKADKISSVSDFVKYRSSLEKLKEEIEKCEVRCANCHRRKTAREFGWFKYRNASVA